MVWISLCIHEKTDDRMDDLNGKLISMDRWLHRNGTSMAGRLAPGLVPVHTVPPAFSMSVTHM